LKNIVNAFSKVENIIFLYHSRIEKCLKEYKLWDKLNKKIRIIKPAKYLDTLWLEKMPKKLLLI